MRGKTALIGFLVLQAAVIGVWVMSLSPVLGSGRPFISSEAHIWSGAVYGVQTDDFRSGASALAAAPFKVYEHLLWAALLIVASAVMAWFAGGAFRRARPWLSSGLSVMAIGLAAGGAYWIVEQWAGDTLFPPGSVNGQVLYMSTRAFMIQFFIGFALLAVFAVLTIAGVATADRPVGYHLAVLNWMIVAVVWTLAYLGLYLTPSLLSSG